ncbi:putative ribosomal protein L7Ae-like [Lentibacillus sp. JNUCC-1]|uniref:ribosomal L7Ae/L30e/S12e/Gadd45 family protein n=1 Tax=Lentibacillus sp. JNUCC-1 TaxID=2654513 RepID=UPI0012E736C4|nr:ribosomal L7Ae/L30e/S12e/Gadd45 family protein [Lentibacillus sp. JNUCC-1]MUV38076.1 putative ribosomal protein L7Ae-like [Lentibacillus sp. JNUCC-1]
MSYEKVTQMQSRVIIGIKQTLKAIKKHEVSEVYVADDAEKHIVRKVVTVAEEFDIPCERVDSMKKLGAASGIEVGAAAVGIKR